MPIEIRELHIKAVVDTGGTKEQVNPSANAEGGVTAGSGEQGIEQVIDICVEKVLEILKEKQER